MECPKCHQDFPTGMKAGYEDSCPHCGARIRVPGDGEEPTVLNPDDSAPTEAPEPDAD